MERTVGAVARYLVGVSAFAIVYALLAYAGYALVPGVAKVTPIWLPAALALAVLLVHGLRYWPGAFVGPLLFSAAIDVPMPVALASCTGNLLAAVLGVLLLQRARFDLAMNHFRDGVCLIFLGAVIPNLAGAAIGSASLYLGDLAARDEVFTVFLYWFLSDTDGVLILTPLLLAAAGHSPAFDYRAHWRELALLALCTLVVATVAYTHYGLHPDNPLPTYLVFPLALWAALRFDALIVGMVLLSAVVFGIGSQFGSGNLSAGDADTQLLEIQTFVAVLSATCVLLLAFRRGEAEARSRAGQLALAQQSALSAQVNARTAELEAANQELAAFNRAISHDLRTPLNGMYGLQELLADELGAQATQPPVSTYLDGLRGSADAMRDMIEALLDLSQSQHRALAVTRVDLTALCRDVLDLRDRAARGPRRAQVEIATGMAITADPVLLRILVQNLLDNALKYSASAEQPRVRLFRQELDERRWLVCEDNGMGFGDEGTEHLFEPFHRQANARGVQGTGIGLATVRLIVERHRGIVRAGPGSRGGARFMVWLPDDAGARTDDPAPG